MSSYYRVLGVSRNADLDEIRQAYWSLSRRVRRGRSAESVHLSEIQRAYETLSDMSRRRAYDRRQPPTVARSRRARPSGPFEDDVARDFPSMGAMARIVPQIREAFFGGALGTPRVTHTTRVELTPYEARQGVQVPLELPFHPDCPVCGGRGETWSEPCGVCAGTGSGSLSHRLQLPVPPGVRHGACLRFSIVPPFAPETQIELQISIQ